MNSSSLAPPAIAPQRPIFVVDDDPNGREFVLDRLERAHVTNPVVPCRHGTEAVMQLAERWRTSRASEWPCLLLLDLRMPGMSGFEVLAWLKAQPSRHGLQVVIVSNCTDASDYLRAKSLGADGFLIKYPSTECLASIVQMAVIHSTHAVDHELPA